MLGYLALRAIAIVLAATVATSCSRTGDEAAIIASATDYVMSAYETAPERLDRSVHRQLQKVGYIARAGNHEERFMDFAALRDFVSTWNEDGRFDPKHSRRRIRILDRLDVTAVVRLDAAWGTDYLQLAKIDDRWLIVNVIWQSGG